MANLAPAGAVSRGLALAEKHVQQSADERRANGDSQLADAVADAIEATIVTTAAQREAALVPRQIPERDGPDHFRWSIEGGAEVEELLDTDEEKDVYDRRLAEYSRLVDRLKAEILAGNYD